MPEPSAYLSTTIDSNNNHTISTRSKGVAGRGDGDCSD